MHFEKKDDILMELTKTAENKTENDAWLSLVERYVRDVEVAGSNPVASIPWQGRVEKSGKIFGFFFLFYERIVGVRSTEQFVWILLTPTSFCK